MGALKVPPAALIPTEKEPRPLNVAVDPWKDPARVIPLEALIPAVNLVSAEKVPPAALIPTEKEPRPLKVAVAPVILPLPSITVL